MLHRIASHILEIESQRPQGNKYKVLHKALINGLRVQFDVLYYSPCLLEEDIERDIGEVEGRLIREHRPVLNYQIPKAENYRSFTVNKVAQYIRLEDIVA